MAAALMVVIAATAITQGSRRRRQVHGRHGTASNETSAIGVAPSSPRSWAWARNHGPWSAQLLDSLQGRSASTHRPESVGPSTASITASTDTASSSTDNEYPPDGPGSDRTHPARTSGLST